MTTTVPPALGFAASLAMAIWTAAAYRRLRTSQGVTAPSAVICLAGGLLVAASRTLPAIRSRADRATASALSASGLTGGSGQ